MRGEGDQEPAGERFDRVHADAGGLRCCPGIVEEIAQRFSARVLVRHI